jgi:hypothetical protein
MQYRSWERQECTTMGATYPMYKGYGASKKSVHPFKRKYKADLKRRWQKDVELELLDRENWMPRDAQ